MSGLSFCRWPALLAGLALLSGCANFMQLDPQTSAEPAFVTPNKPYRLAVVLSSGSLRGLAHFGVLSELKANGIEPDLIVGSSAGAVAGALIASGLSEEELATAIDTMRFDLLRDWTIPKLGLLGGHSIHDFIDKRVKHHRIEAFPIAFAAISVEAERTCLQVFNAGDPGKAAQASSTIPVVLSPPKIGNLHYLDGALASPLPVRVARAMGAERIIAVDVTFDPAERYFANILEAYWRTTLVMQRALAVNESVDADFTLYPRLPPEYMVNFGTRHTVVEAGREAVRKALPSILQVLNGKPPAQAGSVHRSLQSLVCPEVLNAPLGPR